MRISLETLLCVRGPTRADHQAHGGECSSRILGVEVGGPVVESQCRIDLAGLGRELRETDQRLSVLRVQFEGAIERLAGLLGRLARSAQHSAVEFVEHGGLGMRAERAVDPLCRLLVLPQLSQVGEQHAQRRRVDGIREIHVRLLDGLHGRMRLHPGRSRRAASRVRPPQSPRARASSESRLRPSLAIP